MRLLIVRHADPEYANDGLTEEGQRQARALADKFAAVQARGAEPAITAVYSSPKGRARATAQFTAGALGLPVEIEPWTRELSDWGKVPRARTAPEAPSKPGEGGTALWDMDGEFVRSLAASSREAITHESQWRVIPGLAPVRAKFDQLVAESDKFLARHGLVRDEHGRYCIGHSLSAAAWARRAGPRRRANDFNGREQIVVFCHGGFGLTWLSHLLNVPLALFWSSFHLPPASVTTVLFDERSADFAVPRCIGLGDVGHLYAAGLPAAVNSKYEKPHGDRPSGIKANFY